MVLARRLLNRLSLRNNQRGDTIVEVLLATVIISVVLAAAFSLTNRATRLNQTAVERTTAVNLMREQVELIRGARTVGNDQSRGVVWDEILRNRVNSSGDVIYDDADCVPTPGRNTFYLDPAVTDYSDVSMVQTYDNGDPEQDAHPDDLYRIWAEAYERSDSLSGNYVDVHVRVCWEGIGGEHEQRSAIVLRLAV